MNSSNTCQAQPGNSSKVQFEDQIVSMVHPKVQVRVQKWLSQVEAPQVCKIEDPRIPVEIIFQVIEQLLADDDICTATCVALTGRAFWKLFRKLDPEIVLLTLKQPITTYIRETERLPRTLAATLRSWFGPKYRFSKVLTQYLLCSIYGDQPHSPQERELVKRTKDYYSIFAVQGPTLKHRILPNPFEMGMDWYSAAVRQFIAHVETNPNVFTVRGSRFGQGRLGVTMTGESMSPFQLRERSWLTDNALHSEYARLKMMKKSYCWGWMRMYVSMRVPDFNSDGGMTRCTSRRCFWEAIVQASKQDWERHFLLIGDGVKVPRLDR
ncbi:hypothetical protein OCU04_009902 [Sclerotinia nivalis]|uniref:Uncharacterized protein n=1 Tax=Sclerotinia nivalis TaxID=352851 RepID=A0A9X0AEP8_9HELO|nr:hypothetical protein OCU04_009902 [Sclerotinia nivalis]